MKKTKNRIIFALIFSLAFSFGSAKTTPAAEGTSMPNKSDKESQSAKPACGLSLNDEELKKALSPEQYRIMRQNGTEVPFKNKYWDNKHPGIYVDAITGEPLFSSTDKFDSGTGWPSFTKPIQKDEVVDKTDTSQGMSRTEVRSKSSDSHLGHVFDDGPKPTGLRYCLNSAALRFVPLEDMQKQGYGKYLYLFKENVTKDSKTAIATFGAGEKGEKGDSARSIRDSAQNE